MSLYDREGIKKRLLAYRKTQSNELKRRDIELLVHLISVVEQNDAAGWGVAKRILSLLEDK